MKFYLGVDEPSRLRFLGDVPFMLSVRSILTRKTPIFGDWILDSGGFSELGLHGRYTIGESEYLEVIERFCPEFAFCQDWMCEPFMVENTGKSVEDHQELTITSYLNLSAKSKRILPVLQGYDMGDYLNHVEMYRKAGVFANYFGLGSVCGRQKMAVLPLIIAEIKQIAPSIRLHGFGVKTTAFRNPYVAKNLFSADSQAYDYQYRRMGAKTRPSKSRMDFAEKWRGELLGIIAKSEKGHEQRHIAWR